MQKGQIMATITKISAQKRPGRYNIFLDNHYAFSLSEKTIANFVLLKGKELTDEQIDEIQGYDEGAKASDLAAKFLSYEPRTVFEVLQYLKKREVSDVAAANAVNELSELGYLDDEQYVHLFINNDLQVGSDGPRNLTRKLTQKGVDPELVQNILDDTDEDEFIEVGTRLVKSLTNKIGQLSEREVRNKMKTKLLSHGFDSGIAQTVVESFDLSPSEDEQFEALKKQGIKAYKKFRNFDERERSFKIKRYLFTHGFSSGEIDAFLNGEIIDLDELAEY